MDGFRAGLPSITYSARPRANINSGQSLSRRRDLENPKTLEVLGRFPLYRDYVAGESVKS
jgi:hypothetical protein